MRRQGIGFLGVAFALGVALLIVLPASVLAGPSSGPQPSDFGNRQRARAGFFSELSVAVDTNGKAHIAAGNDRDIWYITNRTGAWTSTKAFAHTLGPDGYY